MNNKTRQQVDQDREDATALGIGGIPTFFVNGTKLYQIGYDSLKVAISSELQGK